MKHWQPMHDRILVQRIDEPDKSIIIIPEKYKDQTHIGKVLACGPGKRIDGEFVATVVKAGDLVAFGRFTDFEDNGTCLIQEADVMFKIDAPVKIGIDKFVHGDVGVERSADFNG
jgi:co-chaperonin GroES (HSP10)